MKSFLERILIRILGKVRINIQSDFLSQILVTVWTVARHVSLLLIIILLYLFVLFKNPQGVDIVEEVLINREYWSWTIFALISFGISLWFCSFFILQLKEISSDGSFLKKNEHGLMFWILVIPKILGVLPFILLLFKTNIYYGSSLWFLLILFATIFIISAVQGELVSILEKQFVNVRWFEEVSPERKTLNSLLYFKGIRAMFYCFLGYTLLLFILSLTSVETGFAVKVGPLAILIFGLSFLTVIFSLVMYFDIPGRRPFVIYFIILIAVCGVFNDNTKIRTLPKTVKRKPLEDDFKEWAKFLLASREKTTSPENSLIFTDTARIIKYLRTSACCDMIDWPDSTISGVKYNRDTIIVQRKSVQKAKSDPAPIPVIFVATEGGGIRALTWTALVLKALEDSIPKIYENIYGISGVSGGGVGAIFYASYLHDQLIRRQDIRTNETAFKKAVQSDFLSDLLAAFLFQDNLQNILPVGIESFNRTRRLEDAWSKSFSVNTNSNTLEEGFLKLYADPLIRLPRLFINGVLAETGQKTIVSYPILRNDAATNLDRPDVMADELDVIASINKDIPVKTVASLCSRFPYLTSGGAICEEGGAPIGSVVDGGYKENTGLETVWQLILRLRPVFKEIQKNSGGKVRFKPIVIFIKNSPNAETLDANKQFPLALKQLVTPFNAYLNAGDRRAPTLVALTENVFKYYEEKAPDAISCEFISIELDRSSKVGYSLPLGWYFSKSSFEHIDKLVAKHFISKDKGLILLKQYMKNK
jgi:hypothetical protein